MLKISEIKNRQQVLSNNLLKGFGIDVPLITEEFVLDLVRKGEISIYSEEDLAKYVDILIQKSILEKKSKGDEKVEKVMNEFKNGELKSSSGKKITNREQAIAIAISEKKNFEKAVDDEVEACKNKVRNLKKVEIKKSNGEIIPVFLNIEKGGMGSGRRISSGVNPYKEHERLYKQHTNQADFHMDESDKYEHGDELKEHHDKLASENSDKAKFHLGEMKKLKDSHEDLQKGEHREAASHHESLYGDKDRLEHNKLQSKLPVFLNIEKGGVGSGKHKGNSPQETYNNSLKEYHKAAKINGYKNTGSFDEARGRAYKTVEEHHGIDEANKLKDSHEDLQKGEHGLGSRGGKVIGTTKSGKPIYDSHSHESHRNFTPGEHREAASHHESLYGDKDRLEHNKLQSKLHNYEAKIKEGPKLSSKKESYDWGNITTLSHKNNFKAVLHPEHLKSLHELGHGSEHSFKDEQGKNWKVKRQDENQYTIKDTDNISSHGHFTKEDITHNNK